VIRGAGDRGSASLWLLAVGLVLVVVAMTAATVGAIRVARHQAQTAADLGALAGAARVLHGPQAACARAGAFVAANGGRLRGCQADGLDLQISVEVTARAPGLPGLSPVVGASARAGPVRG
jgi:secretion/DNA translocation related TadE-like protein